MSLFAFILLSSIYSNNLILENVGENHVNNHKRCATNSPTTNLIIYQNQVDNWIENNQNIRNILQVPIAFHVIYDTPSFNGGYLQENVINAQINVLNNAFNQFNISFYLESLNYIQNSDWYHNDNESEYKQILSISPLTTLNIYTTSASGYLGYSYFPNQWSEGSYMHGVVLSSDCLPGGSYPYNDGDTAIHEVGHYFGLYHTFEGGCSNGDQVDDTPAQNDSDSNIFSCNEMDTCPEDEGNDPIRNYMNYTDDNCIDNFTQGQIDRMNYMINQYKSNLGCLLDECGICDGDNSSCLGCDGVPNSGLINDACGICNGDNSTCSGCDGIPNSGLEFDECGICGGSGANPGYNCNGEIIPTGDINQDTYIDINDIILLISIILNEESNPNADINQDNFININDIIQLVQIILNS